MDVTRTPMRILVLTKRQYTNKDLIDDRYGRLYELPEELVRLGHQVSGLCLSYRPRDEGHLLGPKIDEGLVNWYSVNAGKLIIQGIRHYLKVLNDLCVEFKPDIILASSDALHIVYGVHAANKQNIPCVVDLYDNYESFALTRLPSLLPLFKRAIRRAAGVICISNALERYVTEQYKPTGTIKVLANGIPGGHFHPMDRRQCRKELGLPVDVKLIGTAGAIGASRGIDVLFQAAKELIAKDPSIHLILAGSVESGTNVPEGQNIHYLGELKYKQVPRLFNALDVGIICNSDSPFGRYCFPQKAYEMLACGLPVVAADVGTMSELFSDCAECLYELNNQQALVKSIETQVADPTSHDNEIQTWAMLAQQLEVLLIGGTRKLLNSA